MIFSLDIFIHNHPFLWSTATLCFGLLIGSFLNVLIYRLPLMLERTWKEQCRVYLNTPSEAPTAFALLPFNLMHPRSSCPHCKNALAFYDNIPLFSFIALRGRCRACHQPIAWRYPFVEFLSGIATLFVLQQFGLTLLGFSSLLLTYTLIAMMWIDFEHQILPDELTLPFLWLGLLWPMLTGVGSLKERVLGAAVGYLVLYSIYWIFKCLTGKEGMGHGDFKLLAMLGAWLGVSKIPQIVFISSTMGALVGISLLCMKKLRFGKEMPFGPYLATAGWIALIYGEQIDQWYWRFIGIR